VAVDAKRKLKLDRLGWLGQRGVQDWFLMAVNAQSSGLLHFEFFNRIDWKWPAMVVLPIERVSTLQ
jgi:hypothetical protein